MSIIFHAHSAKDYFFTGFVVFSALIVSIRSLTSNDLFSEAEANRTESTETVKATPFNRFFIIIVCIFIIGVAIKQFLE